MTRWSAVALLSVLPLAIAAAARADGSFGHYQPPVLYPDTVSHSFYLPMRDGVRLALRVTRPARGSMPVPGRFPVIWQ